MSDTVFKDANLSDAQVNQNYALKQVKDVNDACEVRLTDLETDQQALNVNQQQNDNDILALEAGALIPAGPAVDGGGNVVDEPPSDLTDLNRRFIFNLGNPPVSYYLYAAEVPPPP